MPVLAPVLVAALAAATPDLQPRWTTTFGDPATLVPAGRNPSFILEPGHVLNLRGTEDGRPVESVITVLPETRTVAGALVRDGGLALVRYGHGAIQ